MKKVFFWMSRLKVEKVAKIMQRVFRNCPFIKVVVEDGACIFHCMDMGADPASWIIEYLVNSKLFMGRFHSDKINMDLLDRTSNRYYMAVCRFGYFDLCNHDNMSFCKYLIKRFELQKSGLPYYCAEKLASECEGYSLNFNDQIKIYRRHDYIRDLVDFHGMTKEDATALIDHKFPGWKDIVLEEREPIDVDHSNELEDKLVDDLIGRLKFMNAKSRSRYLKSNENILDFIRVMTLYQKFGSEWILENVGRIPGIVE
jgi:hypothetical protein